MHIGNGLSVRVEKECCLSSGRCVSDVPEVFAFDPEDLAEVRPDAGVVEIARLRAAARSCPGQAITVSEGP